MLRLSKDEKKLRRLTPQKFEDAGILERHDLEEYLFNSPEAFCEELGEELEIVGKEVQPSPTVQDRIDLLALDEGANSVIIELKRGHNRLQLLQAIAYAGMISKWNLEDFKEAAGEDWDEIVKSLPEPESGEEPDINRTQRIFLVAEDFDFEVLVAAEWLHESYEVDITCIRAEHALDDTKDGTKTDYLAFTQVFPTKGLEEIAISRRQRSEACPPAEDFLKIIDAYNKTAPPELRADGTAPGYRLIHPADWPFKKFLYYSFHSKRDEFLVYLAVHLDAPQEYGKLLVQFDGEAITGATLKWDDNYRKDCRKGRLIARFPRTTPSGTVAQGMHDLIAMTRGIVSNKLKAGDTVLAPIMQ